MFRLEEQFPDQLQSHLDRLPILLLPLGTIEWHSHHLPLGLDGMVAQAICENVAGRLGAVLAPVSYWAVGGVPYPYTLDLSADIVEPLYASVLEQYGAMGFRVIVVLTGHFGLDQTLTVKRAALAVMQRSPVTILPVTEYDLVTDIYTGDHAGMGETSLMWALRPDLVRFDEATGEEAFDGVLGDNPRHSASPEKGSELFNLIAERTAEVSLRLLKQTAPVRRADFIEALRAGVRVLEKTAQLRATMAKKEVPPIVTPSYMAYCQSIYRGDYRAAKANAEQKLAELA